MSDNKGVCKICKETYVKIIVGLSNNGKNIKYVDENGKRWNGLVCPACHKEEIRKRGLEKRAQSRLKKEQADS